MIAEISLDFIKKTNFPKRAGIIDIGGGDRQLINHLFEADYKCITVWDISSKTLEKAKSVWVILLQKWNE